MGEVGTSLLMDRGRRNQRAIRAMARTDIGPAGGQQATQEPGN